MSSHCSTEPPRKRRRHSSHSPVRQSEIGNTQFSPLPSIPSINFVRDDLVDDSSDDPDFRADTSTFDDDNEHSDGTDGERDNNDDYGDDDYDDNYGNDYDDDYGDDNDDDDSGGDESNGNGNDYADSHGHSLNGGICQICNEFACTCRANLQSGVDVPLTSVENGNTPALLHPNGDHQPYRQLLPNNSTDPQGTINMCSNPLNSVNEHLSLDYRGPNQPFGGTLNHQNPVFDVDDLDSAFDEDEKDDPLYHYSEDSCSSSSMTSSDASSRGVQQLSTHFSNSTHTLNNPQSGTTHNGHSNGIDFNPNSALAGGAMESTLEPVGPAPTLSGPLHSIPSSAIAPSNSTINANAQNGDGNKDGDDLDDTEDDVDDVEDPDPDPRAEANNAHFIEFLTNFLTTGMTPDPAVATNSTSMPALPSITATPRTELPNGNPSDNVLTSTVPTSTTPHGLLQGAPLSTQLPTGPPNRLHVQDNFAVNGGVLDLTMEESEGQDDDDDFDYLRESARIRDDPLEYRDDLTVPVEEVAQLLSYPDEETALRPATRASKLSKQRSNQSHPNLMSSAPTMLPTPHAAPTSIISEPLVAPVPMTVAAPAPPFPQSLPPSNNVSCGPVNISKRNGSELYNAPFPNTSSLAVLPDMTSKTAFVGLGVDRLAQFRQQLASYAQIASHVHIQLARKYQVIRGSSCEREEAAARRVGVETRSGQSEARCLGNENEKNDSIVSAYKRSESMLKRFVKHGKTSRDYHDMLGCQMRALQPMANRLLGIRAGQQYKFDSWRSGALDVKLIDGIDTFIRAVSSRSWDGTDKPLRLLKSFWQPYVTNALQCKQQRQWWPTDSGREGTFPWTLEDDFLLALTIAKYGREFGELCKDLLPHREEDDCQRRVRYLASRRCTDNAVKRQVLHLTSPLRPEEIQLMEEGVCRFGNADDPETWKRIQRELLPNREWPHLQRMWNYRKSRRKYKATYRAKVAERKRLSVTSNRKDP